MINLLEYWYEGGWENNCRNGHGTLTWSDKEVYTGEFVGNRIHGKLRLFEVIENKGMGEYRYGNGDKFEGEFEDDEAKQGKYTWKNGDTFEGPCTGYYSSVKPHGIGISTKKGFT